MRQGKSPSEAAAEVIGRIRQFYPRFFGAIISANIQGEFGAACSGMKEFGYSVVNASSKEAGKVRVEKVKCQL